MLSTRDLQSRFRAWLHQGTADHTGRHSREVWPRAGFSPMKWLSGSLCLVTACGCHHHTRSTRASSARAEDPTRTQARAELLLPHPRGSGPCAAPWELLRTHLLQQLDPHHLQKPHGSDTPGSHPSASFLTHCMPTPPYSWCSLSVIYRCLCVKCYHLSSSIF